MTRGRHRLERLIFKMVEQAHLNVDGKLPGEEKLRFAFGMKFRYIYSSRSFSLSLSLSLSSLWNQFPKEVERPGTQRTEGGIRLRCLFRYYDRKDRRVGIDADKLVMSSRILKFSSDGFYFLYEGGAELIS